MNIPELKKIYTEEAVPALMKSQGYGNGIKFPKLRKSYSTVPSALS